MDLRDARALELAAQPLRTAGTRPGIFRGFGYSVRDILAHRELLGLLVNREVKARYKDSALGFVWSLMRPLALLLIYYIALGKFLAFWEEKIEGPIHSVTVAHARLIKPEEIYQLRRPLH